MHKPSYVFLAAALLAGGGTADAQSIDAGRGALPVTVRLYRRHGGAAHRAAAHLQQHRRRGRTSTWASVHWLTPTGSSWWPRTAHRRLVREIRGSGTRRPPAATGRGRSSTTRPIWPASSTRSRRSIGSTRSASSSSGTPTAPSWRTGWRTTTRARSRPSRVWPERIKRWNARSRPMRCTYCRSTAPPTPRSPMTAGRFRAAPTRAPGHRSRTGPHATAALAPGATRRRSTSIAVWPAPSRRSRATRPAAGPAGRPNCGPSPAEPICPSCPITSRRWSSSGCWGIPSRPRRSQATHAAG